MCLSAAACGVPAAAPTQALTTTAGGETEAQIATQTEAQAEAQIETQPSQQAEAQTEAQAEAQTEAQPSQQELEFCTVSYYLRRPVDNMSSQPLVEEEANKIFREKLNAEIQFFPIDSAGYNDKMHMMAAAGEVYDLTFTTVHTNPIGMNVANGAFLPLDDLLEAYGQTILQKSDPRVWTAVTYGGNIMSIPGQSPYSQPSAICFKADLVDKYGLDYRAISDLKGLEPYLKTLKENEPDITPLFIQLSRPVATLEPNAVDITVGIYFDEEAGEARYAIDSEFNLDIYKTLADYYQKGYIAPDALVRSETMQEIKSGKYGVFNDMGGYTEDGSKSSGMFGFKCYESLYMYPMIGTNSMLGCTIAVSATSKNPERAMMMLDLVWADRYLSNTIAYGVEGVNYTVVSGDTHAPSVDTVVEAKSGDEQTWGIWHNWIGPLWDQWSSNWNTTEALKLMQENNKNAPTSKILGFIFDPEPVKQDVAQLNAIMAEAMPILFTGSAPDLDAYLAETRAKIANAGGDAIKAEIERQIAEWKAANQQ
jgi:putative aldouronate transport system substrate-binding protein